MCPRALEHCKLISLLRIGQTYLKVHEEINFQEIPVFSAMNQSADSFLSSG